ncbi:MAG TPA: hypothetical protein VFX25_00215 [Streptosporangiaceae bacterium]|nr:hypothetical protein [Streptosporangiaceae bacterium]
MSSARDKRAGYETGPTPPADAPMASGAQSGMSQGGMSQGGMSQGGMSQGGMTQTSAPQAGAPAPRQGEPSYPRDDYGTGRSMAQSGFTVLAATLLILSGLFSFLEGLVAIFRTGAFFTTQTGYTFQFSLHSWGWVHLGIGIVLFAAGACVLLGQTWAKALGIVFAVGSAIANFVFLPYYPLWSIVLIAVDVFIIWALATGMSRRARA